MCQWPQCSCEAPTHAVIKYQRISQMSARPSHRENIPFATVFEVILTLCEPDRVSCHQIITTIFIDLFLMSQLEPFILTVNLECAAFIFITWTKSQLCWRPSVVKKWQRTGLSKSDRDVLAVSSLTDAWRVRHDTRSSERMCWLRTAVWVSLSSCRCSGLICRTFLHLQPISSWKPQSADTSTLKVVKCFQWGDNINRRLQFRQVQK